MNTEPSAALIERQAVAPNTQARPVAEAWLLSCQGIREGRAFVREELARDFHAQGMTRAADREYEIAKAVRKGEQ